MYHASREAFLSLSESKNHTFDFFPLRESADRKGECGARFMVCPEKARRRGKLRAQSRQQAANAGVFLKITENRRRQLAEIFVNNLSKKSKSHFLLFPYTPQKRRSERGECENFDNKRALKHFRRGEKRRQPQARGGCPLKIKRFAVSLLRDSREALISRFCSPTPRRRRRRASPPCARGSIFYNSEGSRRFPLPS